MSSSSGPTSADISRYTQAIKDQTRAIKSLGDSVRALNSNLVAIHELMKEKDPDG